MTELEKLEFEVLSYAEVPSMPEEANDSTPVWVYAIAKVITYRGRTSFAIVRNNYGKEPSVIKTFTEGGIGKIVSVHPYSYLDNTVIPQFASVKELKTFLARIYDVPFEKVEKLKKEELDRLLYQYCIKYQLTRDKNKAIREREIAEAKAKAREMEAMGVELKESNE